MPLILALVMSLGPDGAGDCSLGSVAEGGDEPVSVGRAGGVFTGEVGVDAGVGGGVSADAGGVDGALGAQPNSTSSIRTNAIK